MKNRLIGKKIISMIICCVFVIGIIVVFINLELNENDVCLVQFESNGGTSIKEKEVKCGTIISKPNNPQKAGFSFKYWEYNGEEYDFSKPVVSNTILKPLYEVEDNIDVVIISFNTKGGNKIDNVEIKKGEKIEKPISPFMQGYNFVGWYINDKEFDFSNAIYQNINLEAKWEKKIDNIEESKAEKCKYALNNSYREIYDVTLYNGKLEKVSMDKAFNQYWYYNENCEIKYETSNSDIATIDKNGLINVLKEGSVTISSCIYNKKDNKQIECFKGKIVSKNLNKLYYDDPKVPYEKIAGKWYPKYSNVAYIKFSEFKVVEETNYQTFTYEFYGINENDLSHSCQSGKCESLYDRSEIKYSDKSILSFEEKYSLNIIDNKLVLSINGKSVEFYREKAVVPIENFTLNKENETVKVGESLSVSAYILPNNATYNQVTWESSNPNIAKITNKTHYSYTDNGSVTTAFIKTLSKGTVVFTATTKDGKYSKKFFLTVIE